MNKVWQWIQRNFFDRLYVPISFLLAAGLLDKWLMRYGWTHSKILWVVFVVFLLHAALFTSPWGLKHLYFGRRG